MPDMVEHIQPPFASVLFRPLPTRGVSPRRLTLRKILEVIRLLLVCWLPRTAAASPCA